MPFQAGNNFGRMGAPVTDALRRAALADDARLLRRACDKALRAAAEGSLAHLQWIADRLDGRSTQRIETVTAGARELDLAAIVQAVMLHRKSEATDATIVPSERLPSP